MKLQIILLTSCLFNFSPICSMEEEEKGWLSSVAGAVAKLADQAGYATNEGNKVLFNQMIEYMRGKTYEELKKDKKFLFNLRRCRDRVIAAVTTFKSAFESGDIPYNFKGYSYYNVRESSFLCRSSHRNSRRSRELG